MLIIIPKNVKSQKCEKSLIPAWLREGDSLTAIVHSERAVVLLTGDLLKGWNQEGKKSKKSERSVKTRGLVLTTTYLPV